MAGVSERPYRVIALKHGAIAAPTNGGAKGLIFGKFEPSVIGPGRRS